VGKQKIENTGMLTRKRMETFDSDVLTNRSSCKGAEDHAGGGISEYSEAD
jgi:hypothetical protein